MDVKGLNYVKDMFIKFVVTQNMPSCVLPLNVYLFKTYFGPANILGFKEREQVGQDPCSH